jgi:hypothetical protein
MVAAERIFWVVEDDDGVASAYARALDGFGVVKRMSMAVETERAIHAAQVANVRPVGAIVDVRLPNGADGLDVMETMHGTWRETPILVCSGLRNKRITRSLSFSLSRHPRHRRHPNPVSGRCRSHSRSPPNPPARQNSSKRQKPGNCNSNRADRAVDRTGPPELRTRTRRRRHTDLTAEGPRE